MKKLSTLLVSILIITSVFTFAACNQNNESRKPKEMTLTNLLTTITEANDINAISATANGTVAISGFENIDINGNLKARYKENDTVGYYDYSYMSSTTAAYYVNGYTYSDGVVTKDNYEDEIPSDYDIESLLNINIDEIKKLNPEFTKLGKDKYQIKLINVDLNKVFVDSWGIDIGIGNLTLTITMFENQNMFKKAEIEADFTTRAIILDIYTQIAFTINVLSLNDDVEIVIPEDVLIAIEEFKDNQTN